MHPIWEEYRVLETDRRTLRRFGVVVGAVVAGIAVLVLGRRGWEPSGVVYTLGGLGGGLMLVGASVPGLLRPIYRAWMLLALVLGFVMTRVLLTLVFFLVVLPTGLVMRLVGKDPMQRRPDQEAPTYWIEKHYDAEDPRRLERYF